MMSFRIVAVFVVVTALCLPTRVQAQHSANGQRGATMSSQQDPFGESALGSIAGNVRTLDGHAVPNATIEIRDNMRGSHLLGTTSDASGSFVLYNIPPGDYEIAAIVGTTEAHERVRLDNTTRTSIVELRLANKTEQGMKPSNGPTVSVSQYKVPAKAREEYEKAAHAMAQGKTDQALTKTNAALKIFPKFAEALTLRGVIESGAGKDDAAIADFQQAIQCDNKYPLSYVALGSSLNSLGMFEESLLILGEAERLAPHMWQTYFELARANIGKGQYDAALHATDRTSQLQGGPEKETPELHLIRAYALAGLTQTARATEEAELYLARDPNGRGSAAAHKLIDAIHAQAVTATK